MTVLRPNSSTRQGLGRHHRPVLSLCPSLLFVVILLLPPGSICDDAKSGPGSRNGPFHFFVCARVYHHSIMTKGQPKKSTASTAAAAATPIEAGATPAAVPLKKPRAKKAPAAAVEAPVLVPVVPIMAEEPVSESEEGLVAAQRPATKKRATAAAAKKQQPHPAAEEEEEEEKEGEEGEEKNAAKRRKGVTKRNAKKRIRFMQASTELCIPPRRFARILRSVVAKQSSELGLLPGFRVSACVPTLLQASVEEAMWQHFLQQMLLAHSSGQMTFSIKAGQLVRSLSHAQRLAMASLIPTAEEAAQFDADERAAKRAAAAATPMDVVVS